MNVKQIFMTATGHTEPLTSEKMDEILKKFQGEDKEGLYWMCFNCHKHKGRYAYLPDSHSSVILLCGYCNRKLNRRK